MRLFPLLCALLMALPAAADPQQHDVTDATGRTVTIPDTSTRIVVLHEPMLGLPLFDLGIEVLGSYGRSDDGQVMTAVNFPQTVLGERAPAHPPAGIGPFGNIDLEKLRALKPDLILGTEYDADKAARLSSVAPVYLQNTGTGRVRGIETQAALAALLGHQDAFETRRSQYDARLERTREALPFDPKGKSYLAVIIHDQINLVGEMSGMVQAIEDLGLHRDTLTGAGAINGLGSNFAAPISAESFMRLNPDVLIVMNSYMNEARDAPAIRDRLDKIAPGWARFLKPAREGRVLFLDSARVTTPTLASAEHTLDAVADWVAQK
ncbi:ABC transporter substrate-binding protein [Actibacterium lipolyticum]|uniref:Putative ABC transporter substrate-binding lipoprotein YhfQ n=1 Tax=Actibacterium lipolyticum TaxID=1524263 RepID=A0A238L7K1_9RHOB|nr:ABC transporter substrate-binding protein [Actibacterium lipolyticum]SMX51064.1 Putative ABC transporter substrate-binding lipoprotein YhfQ precursor [Actibacterium lipolyticum]